MCFSIIFFLILSLSQKRWVNVSIHVVLSRHLTHIRYFINSFTFWLYYSLYSISEIHNFYLIQYYVYHRCWEGGGQNVWNRGSRRGRSMNLIEEGNPPERGTWFMEHKIKVTMCIPCGGWTLTSTVSACIPSRRIRLLTFRPW